MRKLLLYFLFLFLFTSAYSQTYTEKYNSLNKRYEFFNSSGSMIGYKIYNSLNQRWETYMTNTSNTDTTIESNVNVPLAMKVLSTRQNAYNKGKQLIDNKINEMYNRIDETFNDGKDDHGFIKMVQNTYYNKVALVVINKGLDYSVSSNVDWALKFLENNYDWALDQVFIEMERRTKK